jgi:hypothetical protein
VKKFGEQPAVPTAFFTCEDRQLTNKSWTKDRSVVNSAQPMSPASCARKWIVLMGLLCAFPALIFAQPLVPQGGEFPVSGEVIGDQVHPATAFNQAGGWVAWQAAGVDKSGQGIAVRRLDLNLQPTGPALAVNKIFLGDQEHPAIGLLDDGGAVITWQGGVAGFQNIYARFLRPDGTFVTSDVLVSQPSFKGSLRTTTNLLVWRNNKQTVRTIRLKQVVDIKQERTSASSVAKLADGSVVVAYTSSRKVARNTQTLVEQVKISRGRYVTNTIVKYVPSSSDSWQDVYCQRFTAAGAKLGSEVLVNQFTDFNQRSPAVTALADGGFLVGWISEEQLIEAGTDVMARRFGADGAALGDEFRVSTTTLVVNSPALVSAGGGFTVAWAQKDAARTNLFDIYARSYDTAGQPAGQPFLVNSHQPRNQHTPCIISVPAGQLVVWTSTAQDGSGDGVYGRWLNGNATNGDEFRVNTTTALRQYTPTVAGDAGNRALVIWSSYQTLAGFDLFGQQYAAP